MLDFSQVLDASEYTKLLVGLIAIAGPLGAVPIIVSLLGDKPASQRFKVALAASLTFAIALLLFTFAGELLLEFLGITIEAFQIAGGILLLLMALQMMQAPTGNVAGVDEDDAHTHALGIVPIGIPLLAGPGAMSTIIIYTHRHESMAHNFLISLDIISVAVLIFFILLFAPKIGQWVGRTGMIIFNRVMGLIIAAIGIEFIVSGLSKHFPGLLG